MNKSEMTELKKSRIQREFEDRHKSEGKHHATAKKLAKEQIEDMEKRYSLRKPKKRN